MVTKSNLQNIDQQNNPPLLSGIEQYKAYRIGKNHTYSYGNQVYGWSTITRTACRLTPEALKVMDLLAPKMLSFRQLADGIGPNIPEKDLLVLLSDLEKVGFLNSFVKHCKPVSSFNIFMTTRCNLNCVYCYGGEGRESGLSGGSYGTTPVDLTAETGYRIVDYLLKTTGQRENHNAGGINFFGGEPLLNLKVMQSILEYAHEQSVNFGFPTPEYSITTNGTLITQDFINLCKKYRIGVQVSFDGLKTAQDSIRPSKKAGSSSYDLCVQGFKLLQENGMDFRIRGTITRKNMNVFETVKHLEEFGVKSVHFALASTQIDNGISPTENDIDLILEEFRRISEYMLEKIKKSQPYVNCNNISAFIGILQAKSRKSFCCGAGIGLLSVSPDGSLYVCHRFAGDEQFLLGNIHQGIDFERRLELLEQMEVYSHSECKNCWCKDICGGGCSYSNHYCGGNLSTPQPMLCKLEKGMAEIGIHFAAELRQNHEEIYLKFAK